MFRLSAIALALLGAVLCCAGCSQALLAKNNGLQPGMNYMQPLKWRMTYRYRVQEIKPMIPLTSDRVWSLDGMTPAVGKGTWEVWFVPPRAGEEVRGLRLVSSTLEPTKVTTNEDNLAQYYYDLTPDGYLPREVSLALTWEFYTFERYAFWQGMDYGEYDKSSSFYKQYTKSESPIVCTSQMKKAVKDLIPEDSGDYVRTALNCYNYVLNNFEYDRFQDLYIMYTGLQKTTDSYRCWENRTGQCDEFASVLCAMLRTAGIPARPVVGLCHEPITMGDLAQYASIPLPTNVRPDDVLLLAGGHAWTEFYLPEYGWIPADPTWGMEGPDVPTKPELSKMANLRSISMADYYFGKNDHFRIPTSKSWNIVLNPPPKTPKAKKKDIWCMGCLERRSGVREITYGYEGIPGLGGG